MIETLEFLITQLWIMASCALVAAAVWITLVILGVLPLAFWVNFTTVTFIVWCACAIAKIFMHPGAI